MVNKFIYVFTKDAFDKLSESGYQLLKADKINSIYVFENKQNVKFALADKEYLFSDTLTF